MKKQLFLMLLAAFSAACTTSISDDDFGGEASEKAELTFKVYQQTPLDMTDTRAEVPLGDKVDKISLVLIPVDNEAGQRYEYKQAKADESFGTFSKLNVYYGTYDLIVIAHKASGDATITSAKEITFPNNKVLDNTFYYYERITVNKSTAFSQAINLKRSLTRFRLDVQDGLPAEVKAFEFTFSGDCGNTFDATKGYAAAPETNTVTIDLSGVAAGSKKNMLFYTFLTKDEGTIKVVARAKDQDGETVREMTFENVSMKNNYQTRYSGNFYSVNTGWAVTLDSDISSWNDHDTKDF